jgi:Ni/Fe-hydrogenase subunit HybB-like protein
MSLEPHWFSTLFSPYFFMGAFLGGLALTAVTAVAFSRHRDFAGVVPDGGFHDIGKLVFGFCVFWAYLFFSQYIVIWYGKLPLEQEYLVHRLVPPFKIMSSIVFFCLFAIPFFGLLGVMAKKRTGVLAFFASVVLFGLWIERYVLVYPSLYIGAEELPFGWREIGMLPLFAGLMLLAQGWFARTFPMLQMWQPLSERELAGLGSDGQPVGSGGPGGAATL